MMGAGKSSVAPLVAAQLGRPHFDTDREVEAAAGCSIAALFARAGEEGFRRRERAAIAALAGRNAVVALGGGALAQAGMAARLAAAGPIVWLEARPETLLARLGDAAERPLLASLSPRGRLERLRGLLAERAPDYALADLRVATDGATPARVARRVVAALRQYGGGGRRGRLHRGGWHLKQRGGDGETRALALQRGLRVELGERSYPIRIGFAAWQGAGAAIAEATRADRVAVVTAPAVARRYGAALERSLRRARLRVTRFEVPDGDRAKTLRQAAALYRALLAWGADRGTALVALGGGSVGDLAGFVAATYLRGLPFVQVPTTLLAMADASVGGKVGVNLPEGKNLVGAFYQPRLVWIDIAVLRSLDARQRAAGFAEMLKCAAIWDAALFRSFEQHVEAVLAADPERCAAALERCCAIKAEVVGARRTRGGSASAAELRTHPGSRHRDAVALSPFLARRSRCDRDGLRGAPFRGARFRGRGHRGAARRAARSGGAADPGPRLPAAGLPRRASLRQEAPGRSASLRVAARGGSGRDGPADPERDPPTALPAGSAPGAIRGARGSHRSETDEGSFGRAGGRACGARRTRPRGAAFVRHRKPTGRREQLMNAHTRDLARPTGAGAGSPARQESGQRGRHAEPGDAPVLAETTRRRGNPEEALELARRGLPGGVGPWTARVAAALALLDLERIDEARAELESLIAPEVERRGEPQEAPLEEELERAFAAAVLEEEAPPEAPRAPRSPRFGRRSPR